MNPNMESLQGELRMKITGLLFLVSAVTRSVKYMCNQTNKKRLHERYCEKLPVKSVHDIHCYGQ